MSTFMHIPDERWSHAWSQVLRVLKPGSPIAIGVRGSGTDHDLNSIDDNDEIEPKRMFFRRSDANLRRLLGTDWDYRRLSGRAGRTARAPVPVRHRPLADSSSGSTMGESSLTAPDD
jgi:hypothetical protein